MCFSALKCWFVRFRSGWLQQQRWWAGRWCPQWRPSNSLPDLLSKWRLIVQRKLIQEAKLLSRQILNHISKLLQLIRAYDRRWNAPLNQTISHKFQYIEPNCSCFSWEKFSHVVVRLCSRLVKVCYFYGIFENSCTYGVFGLKWTNSSTIISAICCTESIKKRKKQIDFKHVVTYFSQSTVITGFLLTG